MENDLTLKQDETLQFILWFIEQNGFSPSIRDVADEFKIRIRAAEDRIALLEKKGYITRQDKIARSIVVVKK